jgi:hypothetical protein
MAQARPDLKNYPDFTHLLENSGYKVNLNFVWVPGAGDIPIVSVEHPATGFEDDARGLPAMMSVPKAFQKWLDDITAGLGLHKGFSLQESDLRFWGFAQGKNGIWLKNQTLGSHSDVLHLDPQGVYGGRLLAVYDSNGDEQLGGELFGPVNSATDLERILRERNWLGVSSEPI